MTESTPNFHGARVAAFESRKAAEMSQMIARLGGLPFVSPSMREVPVGDNAEALQFARRLLRGEFDIVIFMTGVGVRHLVSEIETEISPGDVFAALAQLVTVARGPKPVVVLKEFGLSPTHRVPEPNTWRDVLTTLDQFAPVAGKRVAVQEYGQPNVPLCEALKARGANLTSVTVYRWELPEDTGPLEANARAIAAGEIDVALFTSSQQVVNLLELAERLDIVGNLRSGLMSTAIASIGPTTSETLRENGLQVDIEPAHAKMGQLLLAAAEQFSHVLAAKRKLRS